MHSAIDICKQSEGKSDERTFYSAQKNTFWSVERRKIKQSESCCLLKINSNRQSFVLHPASSSLTLSNPRQNGNNKMNVDKLKLSFTQALLLSKREWWSQSMEKIAKYLRCVQWKSERESDKVLEEDFFCMFA